jgi:hypothetical protein
MNDLEKFFFNHDGPLIHKWLHYFGIYDRHFSRFRNTTCMSSSSRVSQGGSIEMWRNYFGPDAQICGVDINPECARFERPGVKILIGDQEDRGVLKTVRQACPRIDILIDDGGHTMKQQIATFEELFPHVSENGVYLAEDLHTSYWPRWGGGYRRKGTFIEYSKDLIDSISMALEGFRVAGHRYHGAGSLHCYDSVLVISAASTIRPAPWLAVLSGLEHPSPRLVDKLRARSGSASRLVANDCRPGLRVAGRGILKVLSSICLGGTTMSETPSPSAGLVVTARNCLRAGAAGADPGSGSARVCGRVAPRNLATLGSGRQG